MYYSMVFLPSGDSAQGLMASTNHPTCKGRARPVAKFHDRSGAAIVELAIVIPLIIFLFVLAVDYSRVYYFSQTVDTCARNGAMYAADPTLAKDSPYSSVEEAAKADAPSSMKSNMSVSQSSGTDAFGPNVKVTVSYPFKMVLSFSGISSTQTINRTVLMRLSPSVPDGNH